MGRSRVPTEILRLRGSFQKNPARGRARENEPQPDGSVGEPPSHLSKAAVAIWDELSEAASWLTSADRMLLEITATLMAQMRASALDGSGISKLITGLSKLGFSPTDRSKIQVPPSRPTDPADEFF